MPLTIIYFSKIDITTTEVECSVNYWKVAKQRGADDNSPHPVPDQAVAHWICGNVFKNGQEILAAHIFFLHGEFNVTRRKENA